MAAASKTLPKHSILREMQVDEDCRDQYSDGEGAHYFAPFLLAGLFTAPQTVRLSHLRLLV